MELTKFSDYSMRALIYLAMNQERLVAMNEIAESYQISRNHLMKVCNRLTELGLVEAVRGKGGGLRLSKQPEEINIGAVVRQTETTFNLLECFDPATNTCKLDRCCSLKVTLRKALNAFMAELDKHTLADITRNEKKLKGILATS